MMVKFRNMPLGGRFKYPYTGHACSVIEKHGAGLIACWQNPKELYSESGADMQRLSMFVDEEAGITLDTEVEVIDYVWNGIRTSDFSTIENWQAGVSKLLSYQKESLDKVTMLLEQGLGKTKVSPTLEKSERKVINEEPISREHRTYEVLVMDNNGRGPNHRFPAVQASCPVKAMELALDDLELESTMIQCKITCPNGWCISIGSWHDTENPDQPDREV